MQLVRICFIIKQPTKMAALEVSDNAHGRSRGNIRANRVSTRVDMTPMVDLGFLLITFFMLATTMSKPTSMSVFFPDKTTIDTEPIRASRVLTLFLGNHDEVFYLDGIAPDDDNASAELKSARPGYDLRNVIFSAHKRVNALPQMEGINGPLTVVIKPTAVSSYKNMVDTMDEMSITRTSRYAIVDKLTESEIKLLGVRLGDK